MYKNNNTFVLLFNALRFEQEGKKEKERQKRERKENSYQAS